MSGDMIGYREKMSLYRRRRSLLNKVYRSYRRAGNRANLKDRQGQGRAGQHFAQALAVMEKGEAMGLKIGTIQRSEQINNNAMREHLHEKMKGDAFDRYLKGLPPAAQPDPVAPPQEAPQAVTPLSARQDDDEVQEVAQDPYNPFLHQFGLVTKPR